MGYQELLRALEEEVREEARTLVEDARRAREKLLAETRRAAAAERAEALARLREELSALHQRAEAAARREEEKRLLAEGRRLLDEVRARAEGRLLEERSPALTLRLLDEALAECGEGRLEVEVDPGEEEAARRHLRLRHAAAAGRTAVRAAGSPRGGALVRAGSLILDDTLPSRLERAWELAESEVAALLFGEGLGAL